ncbi:Epoxyqueuosine reductase [hydrothermal vent metagenome]|uniref:Epoxyqueuosine reductase n=1 Tax=hydrothermal vent metagenome TaxID=652676 RepID=A0A3B1B586_9ZZZZ
MHTTLNYANLAKEIKLWAAELGFQQTGIANTDLSTAKTHLAHWLDKGHHGEMEYMAQHSYKRSHPQELIPGTMRIISVRMNYLSDTDDNQLTVLNNPQLAYISRYALGRDYHKLMRSRLQQLASKIKARIGAFDARAFVDSAPVMEKPLAVKAGHGWMGKHCIIVNPNAGSYFFLGELFTNLPLPVTTPTEDRCGTCKLCIDICPTKAIIAPYELDARRCISYLTNSLRGSIPTELRPLIGNRIFGCDDCQLACPWNQFAVKSSEPDFLPRHGLHEAQLIDLFSWTENEFLSRMEGSAIRRIGHHCWLRNIAVALGNAPATPDVITALQSRMDHESELVREHVTWGIAQHLNQ